MERIEKIRNHPVYRDRQRRIEELERKRLYCGHDREHALAVARILYIRVLEEGLSYAKDVVYAAALLHDLGRCEQYENGTAHHEAGVQLACDILPQCGYTKEEINLITEAIGSHREEGQLKHMFQKLLYEADKRSRACYDCAARETCNWPAEKKNEIIYY